MSTNKRTVAVVGASADRSKFSNKAVRAYASQGWKVYPVNPKGGRIEGIEVYESTDDIPEPVDRVTLYLPPSAGIAALPGISRLEPAEFFVNPGAESDELVTEAVRLGLEPILACSIIELGVKPGAYPD